MNRFGMSLAVISVLGLGFTGCGSSDDTAPTYNNTSSVLKTIITVERGKVYDANVTDSSEPKAQEATQVEGKNEYEFENAPIYPVKVNGGWIDVDGDGKQSDGDMNLNIEMKSYSEDVTPITTYIADETDALKRELKLEELLKTINNADNSDINLTQEELLELPSQAKENAQIAINAVYGEMSKDVETVTDLNLTNVATTFQEIEKKVDEFKSQSALKPEDMALAIEDYLINNSTVKDSFTDLKISEQEASEYINAQAEGVTLEVKEIDPQSIESLAGNTYYITTVIDRVTYLTRIVMPSSFGTVLFSPTLIDAKLVNGVWELVSDSNIDPVSLQNITVVDDTLVQVKVTVSGYQTTTITTTTSIVSQTTEALTMQVKTVENGTTSVKQTTWSKTNIDASSL